MTNPTYRSVNVDGLDVFYREAGNPDAQTLLLLHGFRPQAICSAI